MSEQFRGSLGGAIDDQVSGDGKDIDSVFSFEHPSFDFPSLLLFIRCTITA